MPLSELVRNSVADMLCDPFFVGAPDLLRHIDWSPSIHNRVCAIERIPTLPIPANSRQVISPAVFRLIGRVSLDNCDVSIDSKLPTVVLGMPALLSARIECPLHDELQTLWQVQRSSLADLYDFARCSMPSWATSFFRTESSSFIDDGTFTFVFDPFTVRFPTSLFDFFHLFTYSLLQMMNTTTVLLLRNRKQVHFVAFSFLFGFNILSVNARHGEDWMTMSLPRSQGLYGPMLDNVLKRGWRTFRPLPAYNVSIIPHLRAHLSLKYFACSINLFLETTPRSPCVLPCPEELFGICSHIPFQQTLHVDNLVNPLLRPLNYSFLRGCLVDIRFTIWQEFEPISQSFALVAYVERLFVLEVRAPSSVATFLVDPSRLAFFTYA